MLGFTTGRKCGLSAPAGYKRPTLPETPAPPHHCLRHSHFSIMPFFYEFLILLFHRRIACFFPRLCRVMSHCCQLLPGFCDHFLTDIAVIFIAIDYVKRTVLHMQFIVNCV